MNKLLQSDIRNLVKLLRELVQQQTVTNQLLAELVMRNQEAEQDDELPMRDLAGRPIRY